MSSNVCKVAMNYDIKLARPSVFYFFFFPLFHDEEIVLKTQYSSGFYPDTNYPATYHINIVFHTLSEFHPHQRTLRTLPT